MSSTLSIQRPKQILAPVGAFAAVIASLLASGCATSTQTRSGFLSGYGNLKPIPTSPGLFAEKDAVCDTHRSIRVAPVAWQVTGENPGALDEHDRNDLCLFAQSALEHAITGVLPTPPAGRHPLELRSTITRVETSNPALNVVSTFALFMPLNNGGICLEWKLVEPASEKILAQGVAVQTGKPWQFKASFESLGHAKAGLVKISSELASYLAVSRDDRATTN